MTEVLDSGHVVTDEDVDTARLIMELDRTLGRQTDSLTRRLPLGTFVHARSGDKGGDANVGLWVAHDGVAQDVYDDRVLTSEQNAADLAREVGEQLHLDPAEQARVIPAIQNVIRRKMIELTAEIRTGH